MDFPNRGVQGIADMEIQSVVTLLRDKGILTRESVGLLVGVIAEWAKFNITLVCDGERLALGSGDGGFTVVLHVHHGYADFEIGTQDGIICAPNMKITDPFCSFNLLRAVAGGASLGAFQFPRSVYPERACTLSLTLPLAAKPPALMEARSIWETTKTKVPSTTLATHTDLDSMGSTNIGTMFKACSLMKAQGNLCR